MAKFKVRWDYRGRDWHGNMVTLRQGEVIEMDEALATWIEADSPGIFHDVEADRRQRQMEFPGEDRMLRKARTR